MTAGMGTCAWGDRVCWSAGRALDMDFGYLLDEADSFDVMDAAVDAGINHLDTADVCGGPQAADMAMGNGVSEEVLGRWLQRSGRRDDLVPAGPRRGKRSAR